MSLRARKAGHRGAAAALALLLAIGTTSAQAQDTSPDKRLRVSLNTELQVLDPVVTTINATRVFTYLVYDQLIGIDSTGTYRPQMLQDWQTSPDRLVWTFHLRPGLLWSDGTPVTAQDCVASIRRWAQREALGLQMMQAARSLEPQGPDTFVLTLDKPFAFVIEALGKPGNQIPAMMPQRLAALPADKAVPETVGSGPYTFDRATWRPGDRAIFRRNPLYKPRDEPADWLAGGKVARFDRIDVISMPDPATRVAALQAGELDYLEVIPTDFIEAAQKDIRITLARPGGVEQIMLILNINHAQPPFNNPKVRRAAQLAIDQEAAVQSLGLPEGMYLKRCTSLYMCNAPSSSTGGAEIFAAAGSAQEGTAEARRLLALSGYRNEPVVLLHAQSSGLLNNPGLVVADQLRRAGFNVDVRTSDYATVAQRRLSREPTDKGGWSLVPVVWNGIDLINPLANPGIAYNCVPHYPGWYCDPRQTALLAQLAVAADPAERRRLADALQAAFHDNVNYILGGQFSAPAAWRSDLQDVIGFPIPLFWSMSRR